MKKITCLTLMLVFVFGCQKQEDWDYKSVFWGFAVEGFPVSKQILNELSQTKLQPEMIVFYLQWPANLGAEQHPVSSSLETIWEEGAVPCLTWEPMYVIDQKEHFIYARDILNGKYDAYLNRMAQEIKAWSKPLVIRFAHEMNISRYHWGTSLDDFGPNSPDLYIKMYRYVVDFFRFHHVENVFWAFCPNVDSIPNEPWNAASKYYPGDSYVDIFGMDGYNWNRDAKLAAEKKTIQPIPWRSFEQIFYPLYSELKSINADKPIIVFETASVNRPGDPSKSLWIENALQVAKNWGIKGIIWFQINKEEDWRINQNQDYSYISLFQNSPRFFQDWLLKRAKSAKNGTLKP